MFYIRKYFIFLADFYLLISFLILMLIFQVSVLKISEFEEVEPVENLPQIYILISAE